MKELNEIKIDFSKPNYIPIAPEEIAAIVAAREARIKNKNIISHVLISGYIETTNTFTNFVNYILKNFNKISEKQRYQVFLLYYSYDDHWIMLDIKKINYNTCQIIVVDSVFVKSNDSVNYIKQIIEETRKKLDTACKYVTFKPIEISVQTDENHCAIFSLNAGFRLSTISDLHEIVQKINGPLDLKKLPYTISMQLFKLKQFCSVKYNNKYQTKYGNVMIKNKTLDNFIKKHNDGFIFPINSAVVNKRESFKKKTLEYMNQQNPQIFSNNIKRLLYLKP